MKKLLALAFFVLSVTCLMAQTSTTIVGRMYYNGQPFAYKTVTYEFLSYDGSHLSSQSLKTTTTTDGTGYFTMRGLTGHSVISVDTPLGKVNLPFITYETYYDAMLKGRLDVGNPW